MCDKFSVSFQLNDILFLFNTFIILLNNFKNDLIMFLLRPSVSKCQKSRKKDGARAKRADVPPVTAARKSKRQGILRGAMW